MQNQVDLIELFDLDTTKAASLRVLSQERFSSGVFSHARGKDALSGNSESSVRDRLLVAGSWCCRLPKALWAGPRPSSPEGTLLKPSLGGRRSLLVKKLPKFPFCGNIAFLEGEGAETPLRDVQGQLMLGTEKFFEQIRAKLKGKVLDAEIAERGWLQEHPRIEEIVGEVGRRFGVKHEVIRAGGTRGNTARQVALYLSHRYAGLGNEAIGRYFGVTHSSGVTKASSRVKEEMLKNRRLSAVVQDLESIFKA